MNDLVFWLMNAIIDVFLISVIRKDIRLKAKFTRNLDESQSKSAKNDEKLLIIEKKTNQMIAASLIVYTFCRLPELVIAVFTHYYRTIKISFFFGADVLSVVDCSLMSLCYLLSNIADYLYMISYSTNIYFFYQFNKNFRKTLNEKFRFILRRK